MAKRKKLGTIAVGLGLWGTIILAGVGLWAALSPKARLPEDLKKKKR